MSLDKITAQIKAQGDKIPPVELWNPDYCGEMDLQIKANGDWFYAGSIFKRPALVKLLASVLKKEQNDYYLVTPVEKIKITVEDVPFVLTQWRWQDDSKSTMVVTNNVGNEFILDDNHPITSNDNGELYVTVRRELLAKVHRNVYYQWVDLAKEVNTGKDTELIFNSAGYQFSLGKI
ncbi:DUF1285 domain-containing protein [Colwellia sp. 4_MG-2023]|uniref:DUF1285 domain-containing protein n=1 Tax=unclassified Colwellia TaxID=196834 RepID=UPI001C09A833|nr:MULTISPECIES: DUF1285 domain-containing protein [unclassified Colwellia]MBU2925898.1 DUF1285 domain-containing protein [Colwellia sp. C2M11]MDO6488530.1 DUF1285 domain-containing protein [Colwellia sp. 6_MG-2023]MDO6507383.1 DUF1285 domain-containing protein [Colwellia sp. 5_MG-2023]MDO6556197.1 DUF1285 domain-containing protein [Colwellia sp. 4_MG-2023]MDO6652704.1 DUF1285 domain-containing protein [Colwellia sp. 3_MG-2023]